MTYLKDSLLVLGERVSADELHDFSKLVFVLKDLADGVRVLKGCSSLLRVIVKKDFSQKPW